MSLKLAPHLTREQIDNLKLGQNKMTNMLAVFDKICRKYNLSYWPMGGTLIGVARHGGWVPWDADLDVGMFEDEYNKFKEIAEDELPTTMFLQDPDPLIHTICGLRKIRDLYSSYTDHVYMKSHQGLQLDIFMHKIEERENKKLIIANYYSAPWKGYNEFEYDIIFPLKRVMFEDIEIYSPNRIDKFCIQCYDNYPPDLLPIEKRYPHEGNIDPINPSPDVWDLYKDLYEKKTNKWFKNVALNAKDDEPLHHASGWRYLSQDQWNDLCKHSLHGLNINNINRIFDAGCGVGAFLKYINRINPKLKLYGNDICKEAIDKCQKEISNAKLEVGDICIMNNTKKLENKFNFVICMGVVSYLESLEKVKIAVNNFISMVKSGSLISICTLTENKNS